MYALYVGICFMKYLHAVGLITVINIALEIIEVMAIGTIGVIGYS